MSGVVDGKRLCQSAGLAVFRTEGAGADAEALIEDGPHVALVVEPSLLGLISV